MDTYVMSNQLPFLLFLSFHTFAYFFLPPQNTHTQYRYPQAGTDPTASVLHYTRFQQIIRKAWLISSSQPSHQQPAFCKDLVKIPQWYWPKLRNTHCRFGLILDFDTVGFKMDVEMEIWGWWQWQRRAHVYVCVCPIFIHTHKIK